MSDNIRTGTFTRTLSFGRQTADPVQPRFHTEAIADERASAEQGRPIYRDEERVQFLIPGSPNQPVFRVTDEHRQRWPEQYAAFRRGEDMRVEGTPIDQWPALKKAQVLELKALNVFSVEQVAAMSDAHIQRLGLTGHRLRERAQAYLDDAAHGALVDQLSRESDAKDARIAALERQMTEMSALVERLSAERVAAANAPHPLATHIPAQHDPMEALRMGAAPAPAGQSSLDDLAPPKRRKAAA